MKKLGATGNFPQGKLTPDDEGELQLAVGVIGGSVRLDFGKSVAWIGFPPALARSLAASLITAADRIERGQ